MMPFESVDVVDNIVAVYVTKLQLDRSAAVIHVEYVSQTDQEDGTSGPPEGKDQTAVVAEAGIVTSHSQPSRQVLDVGAPFKQ